MSGIVLVAKPSFIFSNISGNETLDNSFKVDISKNTTQENDTGNLKHEALDWKSCNFCILVSYFQLIHYTESLSTFSRSY